MNDIKGYFPVFFSRGNLSSHPVSIKGERFDGEGSYVQDSELSNITQSEEI